MQDKPADDGLDPIGTEAGSEEGDVEDFAGMGGADAVWLDPGCKITGRVSVCQRCAITAAIDCLSLLNSVCCKLSKLEQADVF